MNRIEDVRWQQVGLHVRQPEVFAEAVAGDCFNAAVFAVGIRVVYRTVDEVIQTRQDTQGTGQSVITQMIYFVRDVGYSKLLTAHYASE